MTSHLPDNAGFRSFWMAGFEAASHVNQFGERLDMIAGTRHDQMAMADYAMLKAEHLLTVRDALRWHLIDRGSGSLDFSSLLPMLEAARANGIQVIWSLHHYGFPDDLSPLSARFVDRFVRYAREAAKIISGYLPNEIPYFTPINEISFFTWAGSRRGMYPFAEGQDVELKRQLVRATIEACHALREVDARVRFVFSDPIIQVFPARSDDLQAVRAAEELTLSQFEAWDMIAGLQSPELGGGSNLLDIIGMNFYHSNQWIEGVGRVVWEEKPRDPRWHPLSSMMERVWRRYRRPLFLAETSHVGVGRADWITEVASETRMALSRGVPVEGICLFPILDRYDWDDAMHWHNSGLWDLQVEDQSFARLLNRTYAEALYAARQILPF